MILPNELLIRVFAYIDHLHLVRVVSRVNKKWNIIARSVILWKNVNLLNKTLESRDIRSILKQNLIGIHTKSLKIRFSTSIKNIESSLSLISVKCTSLSHLFIQNGSIGCFQDFISSLPRNLTNLEIIATQIKDRSVDLNQMNRIEKYSLTHINLTDSSWITDEHLNIICNQSHLETLKQLNICNCYRLFFGTPMCLDVDKRFEQMISLFKNICPKVEILNLAYIFTATINVNLDHMDCKMNLLNLIVLNLPHISAINLSGNVTLIDYLLQQLKEPEIFNNNLQVFFTTCFKSNSKRHFLLDLHKWPMELIYPIVHVGQLFIPDGCSLKLGVDHLFEIDNSTNKCLLFTDTNLV